MKNGVLNMKAEYFIAAILSAAMALSSALLHAGEISDSGKIHTVEIRDFAFVPAVITVNAGDTIRWVNFDIVPHTATASDNSWNTGEIKSNENATLVVSDAMVLSYYCIFHPAMTASVQILSEK